MCICSATVAGNAVTTFMAITGGDCDVEKNGKWSCIYAVGSQEYQMVCTRLDIASADVGSLKANFRHMEALLTTEAGYMTFTEAVKEAIWLKGLLEELGVELNRVTVNYDNQGAIHLSQNHVFHERTKHINARYHFIRQVLEAKTVEVLKVGT
nr:retrovirus-related Pol polyprotein from transposon TNT 1-94 [Tanacetum cinerariifolium]